MLEAEYSRTVRVRAPLAAVWDELSPLDRLLRQMPEVARLTVRPDGRTVQVSTGLSWGPLDWKLADASVVESVPPHRLQFRARAPRLRLDFDGTFELARAPSGEETVLTYRGALRCRHQLVGRLRGALQSFLEGHVNGLTERLASRAVQHAEADERLSRGLDDA